MSDLAQAVVDDQWDRIFALLLENVKQGTALSAHQHSRLAWTALLAQLAEGDTDGATKLTRSLPTREWIRIYEQAAPSPFVIDTLQAGNDDVVLRMEALAQLACRLSREEGGRVLVEALQKLADQAGDWALQSLSKAAAIGLCRLRYFSQARRLAEPFDTGMDAVWECMAQEQMKAGLFDAALETIDKAPPSSRMASLRVEILLQAGREADAVDFVEDQLGGGTEHLDRGWMRLSYSAWTANRFEEADALAGHIREERLRTVAQALARSVLQGPEGLSGLQDALKNHVPAASKKDSDRLDSEAVTMESIEPDSPFEMRLLWHGTPHVVMAIVAAKLARKGAIDSALVLSRQVPHSVFSRLAQLAVIKELCRLERLDEAFALLREATSSSDAPAYFGAALVRTGQTHRAVELGRQLPEKLQSALSPIVAEMVHKQETAAIQELLPLFSGRLNRIAELANDIIPLRPARASAIIDLLLPYAAPA